MLIMFITMQNKKEKIVLGFDPGYERCGFGILRVKGVLVECITYGVIKTLKHDDFGFRISEIAKDVESLIDKYRPDMVVIEDLIFAQSTTTALKVAEVRGILRLLATKAGCEVIEVKPTEVKLALTGDGRADKKQVQEMVKRIMNLKVVPKPDDAADALAVAYAGGYKMIL
jgi:crossover junction endodeoxyribonuclease RuvC